MNALWSALLAEAVLVALSLDLASVLVRTARTCDARVVRRVRRTVGWLRVGLVLVAWVIALALAEIPLAAFAVLGVVPLAYGVVALRRHGRPERVEVAGRTSGVVATLSLSGDDVAAFIVLLRWHPGLGSIPVAVALLVGAIGVPLLAVRAPRRGARLEAGLMAAAPWAQLATGTALLVLSAVPVH